MSFSLETTDMDLGDTPIENIFINDFMPMANGTYVKVYLLGFKYAWDKDKDMEVNNRVIAKHLQIPLEDVLAAWDFWEEKGIIQKIPNQEETYNYQVRFLNLKQLYIKNTYPRKKEETRQATSYEKREPVTPQELVEANQNKMINTMFNNINNHVRRITTVNEKMEILSWIKDYNMNPDVIEYAFSYAVNQQNVSYNHMKYVGKTIVDWYDRGLTNLDSVIEDFESKNKRYYEYNKIMKALGLGTQTVNPKNKEHVDRWLDEYKFSMEMILKACEYIVYASQPDVRYIDGILRNWIKADVRTLEDVDKSQASYQKKKEVSQDNKEKYQTKPGKTRFHNFQQRSDKYSAQELEDIARKKREAYMKDIKGDK